MIERRYIELINAEIDGENTAAQSRELRDYFVSHPEAERYYDDLRRVGEMFASDGHVEPPWDLKRTIMASFRERARARAPKRVARQPSRAVWPRRQRARYAYAFISGVIVGACLLGGLALSGSRVCPWDLGNLRGTLGIGRANRLLAGAEPITFDLTAVAGSAAAQYWGDSALLRLTLSSQEEIEVVLRHGDRVVFEGIRTSDNGSASYAVRAAGGRLEITHEGGSRRYDVVFRVPSGARPAFDVLIVAAQRVLFESSVPPRQR